MDRLIQVRSTPAGRTLAIVAHVYTSSHLQCTQPSVMPCRTENVHTCMEECEIGTGLYGLFVTDDLCFRGKAHTTVTTQTKVTS